jgi:hypothetical protein
VVRGSAGYLWFFRLASRFSRARYLSPLDVVNFDQNKKTVGLVLAFFANDNNNDSH